MQNMGFGTKMTQHQNFMKIFYCEMASNKIHHGQKPSFFPALTLTVFTYKCIAIGDMH